MKRVTDFVTDLFVWGVGITKPKPGQQRQAGIYITALLLLCLLAIAAVFFLLSREIGR